MNKMKNSKGFTLMEMLIVVAIIAVLVAIAIPTFTSSLNKARVAADQANIRSGYASLMADILTNQYDVTAGTAANTDPVTYYLQKDGSVAADKTSAYVCSGDSAKVNASMEIAGITVGAWTPGQVIKYTYTPSNGEANSKVTIAIAAEAKQ